MDNYCDSFPRLSIADTSETLLHSVMQNAEFVRREYISLLRSFKAGAARERAISHNLAFDLRDGYPERHAEMHANMPPILRMLRDEYGAVMTIETSPTSKRGHGKTGHKDVDGQLLLSTPGPWDWTKLYEFGYTPETQPHREQWRVLYELAVLTDSESSDNIIINYLRDKYTGKQGPGTWRPHVKLLQTNSHRSAETELFTRTRDRLLPRIISAFAELGETDGDGRVWIEACDETSLLAERAVEVEIIDGVRVGKTRKIRNIR